MPALKIDHERCTECRMCYIVCREIDINAVYVALEPLHRIEIDMDKCTYPGCTACLMYCPAEGSIIEVESGRSMVPPPPEAWQEASRMHPILDAFLGKWVWPTMPGAPGAEFRLRLTREKCLKGWEISLQRTLGEIEEELGRNDEAWKKERALRGYAAEGVHMSIKQMSGQLLSVDIADQERYIDLQRMRARQIWDECKHSKLHADVLLGKGWIKNERELMDIAQANTQPLPAYFGLSMMFPHIHPLARAAQNYYQEANACIGIMAYLDRVDDPLVRHEHLSQRDEELMHFMEGKFQIDFLCATAETQKPVEDALDYLLHQVGGIR